MNCNKCQIIINNTKINYLYTPVNFTGDKPEPGAKPNTFFCSQECKKVWVKDNTERQERNKPYLAELDQSMNYCEWFLRTNGNWGKYVRDGFEFEVNGLWDYKSFNKSIKRSLDFKKAFEKHFGDFEWFKLHSRYKL